MSEMMTVQGLMLVVRNITGATLKMQKALAAALYEEGLIVTGEAQKRTPVDTGRLRSTGYTAPPMGDPRDPEVECGFGTDYGLAVHERVDVYHDTGGPKFLESVFKERQAGYANRVAKRTWDNYESGKGAESILSDVPEKPKSTASSRKAARKASSEGR